MEGLHALGQHFGQRHVTAWGGAQTPANTATGSESHNCQPARHTGSTCTEHHSNTACCHCCSTVVPPWLAPLCVHPPCVPQVCHPLLELSSCPCPCQQDKQQHADRRTRTPSKMADVSKFNMKNPGVKRIMQVRGAGALEGGKASGCFPPLLLHPARDADSETCGWLRPQEIKEIRQDTSGDILAEALEVRKDRGGGGANAPETHGGARAKGGMPVDCRTVMGRVCGCLGHEEPRAAAVCISGEARQHVRGCVEAGSGGWWRASRCCRRRCSAESDVSAGAGLGPTPPPNLSARAERHIRVALRHPRTPGHRV